MADDDLTPAGANVRPRAPSPPADGAPPVIDPGNENAPPSDEGDAPITLTHIGDAAVAPGGELTMKMNRHRELGVRVAVVASQALPLQAGEIGIARESLPKSVRKKLKAEGKYQLEERVIYDVARVVMEYDFREPETQELLYHMEGFVIQVVVGDSITFALELENREVTGVTIRDMTPQGWNADGD